MEYSIDINVDEAPSDQSSGSLWKLVKFEASKKGEVVGFIMVSFITSETIRSKRIDTDILSYLKISIGRKSSGIVPRSYTSLETATDEEIKSIEYGINEMLHGWEHANKQQSSASSRQERIGSIRMLLPQVEERVGADRQSFLDFHVDKPMVDKVEVHPDYRRQGIGLALYEKAATWAKDQGMSLHASQIQTEEAKAVWKSMYRRGLVNPGDTLEKEKPRGSRPRML